MNIDQSPSFSPEDDPEKEADSQHTSREESVQEKLDKREELLAELKDITENLEETQDKLNKSKNTLDYYKELKESVGLSEEEKQDFQKTKREVGELRESRDELKEDRAKFEKKIDEISNIPHILDAMEEEARVENTEKKIKEKEEEAVEGIREVAMELRQQMQEFKTEYDKFREKLDQKRNELSKAWHQLYDTIGEVIGDDRHAVAKNSNIFRHGGDVTLDLRGFDSAEKLYKEIKKESENIGWTFPLTEDAAAKSALDAILKKEKLFNNIKSLRNDLQEIEKKRGDFEKRAHNLLKKIQGLPELAKSKKDEIFDKFDGIEPNDFQGELDKIASFSTGAYIVKRSRDRGFFNLDDEYGNLDDEYKWITSLAKDFERKQGE